AVPQGLAWGGAKTYDDDQTSAILRELDQLTTVHTNNTDMAFWATYQYSWETDEFGWIVNQGYNPSVEYPPVFQGLNEIPSLSSTLRLDRLSNFSVEAAGATPWPRRNLFASVSHLPSLELEDQLLEIFRNESRSVQGVDGFSAITVTQPFFEGSVAAMKVRGGNPVSVQADGPFTVKLLIFTWLNADDDEVVYRHADRWIERATAAATEAGLYHPYLYINYALRTQDPFAHFPAENVERLRSIQRSVDPTGIFTSQGLCRGYFKLL
ncbi:hypothetical protein B0J12DRAFT_582453, partial [Macrophomina phaseolina]